MSDVTDNLTRQASAGVRVLLGIKQTDDTNTQVPDGVQQGGGMIPAAISPIGGLPQMSPVTINVINGGSDNGSAPVNQNGGKKPPSQDRGDIFNFKGGFSKQQSFDENQDASDENQDASDGEPESGSNSKVIRIG